MAKATRPKFEQIADKWSDDALATRLADLPACVYHYTDANGLIGMMRSGKIWATDYRFLNDRSEIEHTRTSVRELLSEKIRKRPDILGSQLYAKILEGQSQPYANDLFVFSMSEERDDLSQWRGYAREGRGFTIGFCASTIYSTSQPDEASFGFARVEYNHAKQTHTLERALEDIEGELRRLAAAKGASAAILTEEAAYWFNWIVQNTATLNKHKSFQAEKEWRIISFANPDQNGPRVRARGLSLVRYAEHSPQGESVKKLPIKEIGIGPGFVGSEDVHAVRDLCRETDYDPIIYSADTPFRRT